MADLLARLGEGVARDGAGAAVSLVAIAIVLLRGRGKKNPGVALFLGGLTALLASFGLALAGDLLRPAPLSVLDPAEPVHTAIISVLGIWIGLPLALLGGAVELVRRHGAVTARYGSKGLARAVDDVVRLEDDLAVKTRDLASVREKLRTNESKPDRPGVRMQESIELLMTSEERFGAVLEMSGEGVFEVDLESGRLRRANRRLGELTGLSPSELVKLRLDEVFGAAAFGPESGRLRELVARGGPPAVTLAKPDGERVEVEIALRTVEVGASPSVMGLVRDVGERARLHGELEVKNHALEERERNLREVNAELSERAEKMRAMNERLRELQEVKDNFLSSVSHELRTPLTSIRSFSEILLQYKDAEDEVKSEFITIINKESERLTRLINDVLDLARIEAGEMKFDMAPLDLREVCRDVAQSLSPLAGERDIRITDEFEPGLPAAHANRDKIQQVLTNLVSNALKVAPDGSGIRIAARRADDGELLVAVRDQGPGIPREERDRIFDKFQQLQSGDTVVRRKEGTGLGLAICREIVALHGGRIWAKSAVGEGSTFFFTLPTAATATTTGSEGRPGTVRPPPEPPEPEEAVAAASRSGTSLPPLRRAARPTPAEERPRRTLPPLNPGR